MHRCLRAACGGDHLEQALAAGREGDARAADDLAGHRDRIGRTPFDDHEGLRVERLRGEPLLDRVLHLARRSVGDRDAPGIGNADTPVGGDLLIGDASSGST